MLQTVLASCLAVFVFCGLTWRPHSDQRLNSEIEKYHKIHEAAEAAWAAKVESLRFDSYAEEEGSFYGKCTFITSEGVPGHRFNEKEQVEFSQNIYYDGQYFLTFDICGEEKAQVRVSSDTLDMQDVIMTATSEQHSAYWKVLNLTKGKYDFTAESLGDTECDMTANIGLVQKLKELPSTLQGQNTVTYLCTLSEDRTVNYTFRREGISNGPLVVFYSVNNSEWIETIDITGGEREVKGSIDIPAGDILISFYDNSWSIEFE